MKIFAIDHFHPAMLTPMLFNDILTIQEIHIDER